MEQFTVYTLCWYFIIYAFLGWCTEVAYAALNQGRFVNRGFLNGPYCPIYGFGVLLVLSLLLPIKSNLLLVFLGAVVLTSALEWLTGFVLEKVFHDKWWDYSDMPFNLHGYICLKFSILWGLACVLIVELVQPVVAGFVGFVPHFLGGAVMALLLLLFFADTVVTVGSMLKLNKQLSAMREITGALRETSDLLGQNISEGVLEFAEKRSELREELEARKEEFELRSQEFTSELKAEIADVKEGFKETVEDFKDDVKNELFYRQLELLNRYEDLTERYNKLADRRKTVLNRVLKAFPDITSNYYKEELEEIKARYRKFVDMK